MQSEIALDAAPLEEMEFALAHLHSGREASLPLEFLVPVCRARESDRLLDEVAENDRRASQGI